MPYRNVFVTVGSTVFDDLVHAVLAKPVMDQLRDLGCESLLIQQGHASIVDRETVRHGIRVTSYHYATSLQQDLQQASLVISHGRAAFVYTRTVAHHVLAPLAGTAPFMRMHHTRRPHPSHATIPVDAPLLPFPRDWLYFGNLADGETAHRGRE